MFEKWWLSDSWSGVRGPLWALALAALSVLLFIGGPEYSAHRLWRSSWNLGHWLLFALITRGLIQYSSAYAQALQQRARYTLAASLLVSALLAAAIEWLQLRVGRSASLWDVLLSLLGVGWVLAPFVANGLFRPVLRTLLLATALTPTALIANDEWAMHRAFPLLSGAEHWQESSRWQRSNSELTRSSNAALTGHVGWQVALSGARYSGVSLQHLVRDWRGYSHLHLLIVTTESSPPFDLVLRIDDVAHWRGAGWYSDRYNRRFSIQPGRNQVLVPLVEIEQAPATRLLDLDQIFRLSLFLPESQQPVQFYLDDIRLIHPTDE